MEGAGPQFRTPCTLATPRANSAAPAGDNPGRCAGMLEYGVPDYARSDNGAEMTARRVRSWLARWGLGLCSLNRYCESFNGKLRDECLNGEIFYSLQEAQVVVEMWRKHYNTAALSHGCY